MGAGASYPKPDLEKRNKMPMAFGWTDLPAEGRLGPPPKLPQLGGWCEQTRDAWAELWSSPQATAWDQTGRTMHGWAVAHHELHRDLYYDDNGKPIQPPNKTALLAEMRQIEDRHGLNPKAMLQLRWRIVEDEPEVSAPVVKTRRTASAGRRGLLKVVANDGARKV